MNADAIIGLVMTYLSAVTGPIDVDREVLRCMADNIYFEAALESREGKRQVAYTVLDRVQSKHYPNKPCNVIWQRNKDYRTEKMVAMFSWTLDGKSDRIKFKRKSGKINNNAYKNYVMSVEEAVFVLLRLKNRPCEPTTTHYWSHIVLDKPPYWAKDFAVACKLGGHTFMTAKKNLKRKQNKTVAVAQ